MDDNIAIIQKHPRAAISSFSLLLDKPGLVHLFLHVVNQGSYLAVDVYKRQPAGNLIQVTLEEKCLKIFNHGGHIEESLLPDIYEPFVSSDVQKKGRGLGLYILSYYAQILGCDVKIVNESGGVLAILRIP